MSHQVSSQSLEYVKVQVAATKNGAAVNPTSDTVKLAFPAVGADPTSWNAGSWETETVDPDTGKTVAARYYARCLVGAGGAVQLPVGVYDVYVQITDNPETPVIKAADTLEVY